MEEMLACARRELAMRKKVYPRLIDQGKMTLDVAVRETKCMEAIVEYLSGIVELKLL